ncbi:hypothetical protein BDV96DRAFT_100432 [Lophiotrema nucula]|uniref:C2H2-type domain-containing protein n=1 Tax=Lophiotrema nucula TaxID=690887 RepID=A0A6A5Z668_9PLEO|nr:hypothetical protein BDV96DRAFT_100432 [Lophiotrema nucula]
MDSHQGHLNEQSPDASMRRNDYYSLGPPGNYTFESVSTAESTGFTFNSASFMPQNNSERFLESESSGYTPSSRTSSLTWEDPTSTIFEPQGERPPIPPFSLANLDLTPSFFSETPHETRLGSSTDLNGLSTSPVQRAPRSVPSDGPLIVCTECSDMPTFSRQPEKDRHDRAKHGCNHPDCGGRGFLSAEERHTHMVQCHGGMYPGLFNCGTCQLRNNVMKTRKDKLKKHFKSIHKTTDRFSLDHFQCRDSPCYDERLSGGLYFASMNDLVEHRRYHHLTVDPLADKHHHQTHFNTGRVQLLVQNLNSGNVSKHGLEPPILESLAKRSRSERSSSGLAEIDESASDLLRNDTPLQDHTMNDYLYDSLTSASDVGWQSTSIEISMFEISGLNQQFDFPDVIDWLRERQIYASFYPRKDKLQLGGPCSEENLKKGRAMVEKIIRRIPPADPWQYYQQECPVSSFRKGSIQQRAHEKSGVRIAIVDPKRDRDAIETWTRFVLPRLPNMMKQFHRVLGPTYSAVLVCHIEGNDAPFPIIRFCSSKGQADITRTMIRDMIASICRRGGRDVLDVHFSEGTAHRLVGGRSSDSRSNDQKPFPHGRRPWHKLGMGVSMGMSNCIHVSASSGGYLAIGGVKFMLSVNHMRYPRPDCTCPDDTQDLKVSAPSLGDISDLRELVRMRVEELRLKMKASAPDSIPLDGSDTLDESLFHGSDKKELKMYESFGWALNKPNQAFELGDVERSGSSTRVSSSSRYTCELPVEHQMDWCLIQVKRERMGKNRHRHRKCTKLTLDDLSHEDANPLGVGRPCEMIGDFRGGEAVYYVGPTSGLREGYINPVPQIQGKTDGSFTLEWAMVVDGGAPDNTEFEGDSGTWILDSNEHAIGMLWSWNNGLLNFTPLDDIIADIHECAEQWRHIPITLPPDESGIQYLNRKHNMPAELSLRLQTPARTPFFTIEPPKAMPDMSMAEDAQHPVRGSVGPTRSVSPIPSLIAYECSSPESSIPPSPDPPGPSVLSKHATLPLGPMAMTIKAITWPMDIDVRLKKSEPLNDSDFTSVSLRQPIETC